jgi:hypothetical protein
LDELVSPGNQYTDRERILDGQVQNRCGKTAAVKLPKAIEATDVLRCHAHGWGVERDDHTAFRITAECGPDDEIIPSSHQDPREPKKKTDV